MDKPKMKIKITSGGPYIVTGGVPLSEKRIEPQGKTYVYAEGQPLPQNETYALCRCGHSKNAPFCDGSHEEAGFDGEETASRDAYMERAQLIKGPGIDLYDDNRCAFARFCHRQKGDVWELTEKSDAEENRQEVIRGAMECPSGRITAADKDGRLHEPALEPGIEMLEDPQATVSCGIYVKGGILIEGADGQEYPRQNRVVLCRCGLSKNQPFCDSAHFLAGYVAKKEGE